MDEKRSISSIVKHYGKTRTHVACRNAIEWLARYSKALNTRYHGFDGRPLTRADIHALKHYCRHLAQELKAAKQSDKSSTKKKLTE